MRRDRLFLPILLSLCMALSGASAAQAKDAKGSDDDLLGNIGDTPSKPSPKPSPRPAADDTPPAKPVPQPAPGTPEKKAAITAAPSAATAGMPGVVDRVKSVPRKQLLKRRRLELTPFVGMSLNDPYYLHLSFGGSAIFYPHDAFGIGVGADWLYLHAPNNNIAAVREGLTSVPGEFNQPTFFAHADMYWLPIYGKVSLFNSWIIHFDIYASAGMGVATALDSHTPVAANFAIGQHYAIDQWVALRFEVRDHWFVDTQRANQLPRSSIQSYLMFLAGISFFIPPTFEYSFQ